MRQLLQAARCAIDALAEDSKDGVVKEVPPSNGPDLQPSNDLSAGVSLGAGGNSAARPTSLVGIRHMAAGVAQLQVSTCTGQLKPATLPPSVSRMQRRCGQEGNLSTVSSGIEGCALFLLIVVLTGELWSRRRSEFNSKPEPRAANGAVLPIS